MQRVHSAASAAGVPTVELEESMLADGKPKIDETKKSRKPRFVRRPPLSRLRRRFAPLRGTQRRAAPSAELRAPPLRGATHAPRALRAQTFCQK